MNLFNHKFSYEQEKRGRRKANALIYGKKCHGPLVKAKGHRNKVAAMPGWRKSSCGEKGNHAKLAHKRLHPNKKLWYKLYNYLVQPWDLIFRDFKRVTR